MIWDEIHDRGNCLVGLMWFSALFSSILCTLALKFEVIEQLEEIAKELEEGSK